MGRSKFYIGPILGVLTDRCANLVRASVLQTSLRLGGVRPSVVIPVNEFDVPVNAPPVSNSNASPEGHAGGDHGPTPSVRSPQVCIHRIIHTLCVY